MKKKQAKKSAKKSDSASSKKTKEAKKRTKLKSSKPEKSTKKTKPEKSEKSEKSKKATSTKEEPLKSKGKKGSKSAPSVITTSKVVGLKLPELLASDSFRAISAGFDKIEDDLESHAVYLKAASFVKNALPTGILHYDLMMGGGLAPGKMTVEYGPEGSAKSTRFFTAVTSALLANTMPIVEDAESALNAGYVDRIIRKRTGYTLDDLVGEQDDAGNWIKPPFIRYYNETNAQKVFRRMKRSLDLFPDVVESRAGDFFKVWRGKDGSIIRREEYDGSPQAAYFIDSAAALVPASVDDNDESNAMAAMARVFSWGFPLVKGRVAAKRVCLFFTNQVRSRPGMTMGCVHSDTSVTFADGRSFTMEHVVRQKIHGKVWSLNETTGLLEQKRITGWHHNGYTETEDDWVHITAKTVNTRNGVSGMTLTRDHKVITARGWVRAADLKITDKLVTRDVHTVNGTLAEFLYGTLVGDCALVKYNRGNAAALNFTNNQQHDYVQWKLKMLSEAFTFTSYENKHGFVHRSNLTHELALIKDRLGCRSIKNFVSDFTALSLAVWYMDDGHVDIREGHNPRVTLSAKRFANNCTELQFFIDMFARFNIAPSVNVASGALNLGVDDSLRLFKLIAKYVPPCMSYKLPEQYRAMHREFKLRFKTTNMCGYVDIVKIRNASRRQMRKRDKYDITVEDNHNYMVGNMSNGVIVHNSPTYMPGGATFQHNNDARNFTEARHPKSKEMGMDAKQGENFTREKSIEGGEDRYHYQRIRNEKNKQFTPRRTALMRTRLEHNGKPGDGVCETFDVFQYLRTTGQAVKRGETITFSVEPTKQGGKIPDLLGMNGGKCDWATLKKLVELPENKKILQKHCRAQLVSGYAFQLESQAQSKGIVIDDGD